MSITRPESLSEQTTRATRRPWPSADDWQRAWEALAEPEEPAAALVPAEEPKLFQCDCCNAVVLEEETVGGGYCRRICFHCADTEQGERWTPEEFFEEGGDL